MRIMRLMITLALAIAGLVTVALPLTPAAAQDAGLRNGQLSSQRRVRAAARPRIVVTPAHRLVRNCVDIYVVEHRPTGPTVVPDMRCWWAYR
jgi:hypothetical protein